MTNLTGFNDRNMFRNVLKGDLFHCQYRFYG